MRNFETMLIEIRRRLLEMEPNKLGRVRPVQSYRLVDAIRQGGAGGT